MNLGVIGLGNMASAIIRGIEDRSSIYACGRSFESIVEKTKDLKINACHSYQECIENSDIILLSIKPQQFDDVLPQIAPFITTQTVVSIAAKKTIHDIETHLGPIPVIRVMPNLTVAIREGITAMCSNNHVDSCSESYIRALFENLGSVIDLPESKFSGFIGIAGSSPAFIFEFIEGMANSVVQEGIPYNTALEIVCKTVLGSASFILKSDEPVDTLINNVCSPGGTTIEGIKILREANFKAIINQAVAATIAKDKE